MAVYPYGENGALCEIIAVQDPWGENIYIDDFIVRSGMNCIIGPQYRYAAIAAYRTSGGGIYEIMWLWTD
jgi:hypothetical protein